jgi:death on curing protein
MILLNDILNLHDKSIEIYGGAKGIRDHGLLESAIARPFQTFGGEDLYPSPYEKAAALAESLIINHPFIDGNKRTGMLGMATFLLENGIYIETTDIELYEMVIKISTGEISFEQIVDWLKSHTAKL